jgi:hypothetical protein
MPGTTGHNNLNFKATLMKSITHLCGKLLAFSCMLTAFAGCKGMAVKGSNNDSSLIAYKNSAHYVYLGFLVHDGNDPVASTNPANSPDSVDFLEFFAGRDTVQADWRAAQAKGTRIVVCYFPSSAYFDGSVNDPATKAPGYVNPPGFDQHNPTDTSTYNHFAKNTYTNDIVNSKLNGIDIDLESGTFGGEVPESNGPQFLTAIAQYYGPNCTACTVPTGGKKPVFFYDTDGTVDDDAMYTPYESNYDYVDFQSYTTGNRAWGGSGTADFGPLIKTYGLNKLIFLVNGDSFVQANGAQSPPGSDSVVTASLYSYATWVKANKGIGVGAYRMSRDYNHKPPFAVSRNAIQIMNPAK